MDSTDVGQLETLLSAALRNLVFRRGSSEQMSANQYRRTLERCRAVYEPASRFAIPLFTPEISDPIPRGELTTFVNGELSSHIRGGLIHSATFPTLGGMVSGSPVEHVVENLLRRATVDGPKVAAAEFAECARNVSCNVYRYFLLPTIAVEDPVELLDGISIVPLADSIDTLPSHLPWLESRDSDHSVLTTRDLLGRSLLCIQYDVSPVFHRPDETYTFESTPDKHFRIKISGDSPEVDADALWQALSVASRRSVRPVMTWAALNDYEIFDLGTTRGIGASGWSFEGASLPFEDPVVVRRPQLEQVGSLYRAILNLPPDTWAKLHVPIDRWMKSMEQENPLDQIIDLGIALESLYVPLAQSEVSFRFALHAAWHLGRTPSERSSLREELQEIYAARSDVVHGGKLRGKRAKPEFDLAQLVIRAQELCRQGITAVIEAGEIPDWNSLVVGEEAN